jgi:transcription elongation factor Elf1
MSARAAEHAAWNREHGLADNQRLFLSCPRCGTRHTETLTSDETQPDYFHHVHQCLACGLRFDLFVRTRAE